MVKYIKNLNSGLKEYFNILCNNDYPNFIDKYIELDELQRLKNIGQFCGWDYTKIYNIKYWYSRLDHSIACALMAWHFTKDKTQTLAALFHDMGTPAFSHCIDYLLGDTINQESSEKDVYEILKLSPKINEYLKEDNVDIEELNDISRYTIIENKKPKLCVDRLEGIIHTCLMLVYNWNTVKVRKIYENIVVLTNEFDEKEIGFSNLEICEIFYEGCYRYSIELQKNEDKFILKYISHVLEKLIKSNIITIDDLYVKSEAEVIKIINEHYGKEWNVFVNATSIKRGDTKPENVYSVSLECKKRYVIPLCLIENKVYRLNDVSEQCKKLLEEYLSFNDSKYSYVDGI